MYTYINVCTYICTHTYREKDIERWLDGGTDRGTD